METVFRNHLVTKNQSLRGNVFVNLFPRNGHHLSQYNIILLRHNLDCSGRLSDFWTKLLLDMHLQSPAQTREL
jgi:hypothetical protein